jgi:hypothetical protein
MMGLSYIDRSNIDMVPPPDIKEFENMSNETLQYNYNNDNNKYKKYIYKDANNKYLFNKGILYKDISLYNKYQKIKTVIDKRVITKNCNNNNLYLPYLTDIQKILCVIFGSDYINITMIEEEMGKKSNERTKEYNYINELFHILTKKGEDYTNKMDIAITNLSNNTKITDVINKDNLTNIASSFSNIKNNLTTEFGQIGKDITSQVVGMKDTAKLKMQNIKGDVKSLQKWTS